MTLRQLRRFHEIALDELALELGEGYSVAVLSILERGRRPMTSQQEAAIREGIARILARREASR